MKDSFFTLTGQELLFEINKHIEELLPSRIDSTWLEAYAKEIPVSFDKELLFYMQKPARELLLTGGKRWRPLLLILCSQLSALEHQKSAEEQKSILNHSYLLAVLVELAHNGSLMIDDIEDKSEERRGIPAAYLSYGEDLAINAGNWLYFLPTVLIEKLPLSANQKALFYEIYCRSMRKMHLGQGIDITWHQRRDFFPSPDDYFTMCRLKTGSLSSMAMELGYALAAEPSEYPQSAKGKILTQIAENAGVAFQIFDDITNLRSGNPGKKRGDDLIEGKKSYPLILFVQKKGEKELVKKINSIQKKGIHKAQKEIDSLVQLLEESNSINEAEKKANQLLEDAIIQLQKEFTASSARNQIQSIIERFKTK